MYYRADDFLEFVEMRDCDCKQSLVGMVVFFVFEAPRFPQLHDQIRTPDPILNTFSKFCSPF